MEFLHSLDIDGIRCELRCALTCSEHTQLFSLDSNQVSQIVKHSIETKIRSIYNRPWSRGNRANPLDEGSPPVPVEGIVGNSVPYQELQPTFAANGWPFQPALQANSLSYTNNPYYFGNMMENRMVPNSVVSYPRMPIFEPVPKRLHVAGEESDDGLEEIVDSSMEGNEEEMIDLVNDSSSDSSDVENGEQAAMRPPPQQIPSNVIFDIDSSSDSFSVCNKRANSPHLPSRSTPPCCLRRPLKNC